MQQVPVRHARRLVRARARPGAATRPLPLPDRWGTTLLAATGARQAVDGTLPPRTARPDMSRSVPASTQPAGTTAGTGARTRTGTSCRVPHPLSHPSANENGSAGRPGRPPQED